MDLVFHHQGTKGKPLEGNYFIEPGNVAPARKAATVTEHSFEELGTVAVSLVIDGGLQNYYPLSPEGLNAIHTTIRKRVPGGNTVAFPGTILYDERSRSLQADSVSGTPSM